ncbi:MAG: hypothetical protein ACKVQS_06760 [Fimbriimonadaceae bacterium]
MTPKLIMLIACRVILFNFAFNILLQFGSLLMGVQITQIFLTIGIASGAILILLFAQNQFARGLPETPLNTKVQPQQVMQLLLILIAIKLFLDNLISLISHFVTGQISSPAMFIISILFSACLITTAKPIALLISPLPKETI